MADVRRSPAALIWHIAEVSKKHLGNALSSVEKQWKSDTGHDAKLTPFDTDNIFKGSIPKGADQNQLNMLVYSERFDLGGNKRTVRQPGEPNSSRMFLQFSSEDIDTGVVLGGAGVGGITGEEALALRLLLCGDAGADMLKSQAFLADMALHAVSTIDVFNVDPVLPEVTEFVDLPNIKSVLVTFTVYTD